MVGQVKSKLIPKVKFLRKSQDHPENSVRILHKDQPGGPTPRGIDVKTLEKLSTYPMAVSYTHLTLPTTPYV